jgi:hypothetical protein
MVNRIPVSIPINQTKSDAVQIPDFESVCAVSILTDGFQGATFSFEISFDNGTTYLPVRALGGASVYTVTAAATKAYFPIDSDVFFASHTGHVCLVRVVSAATESTGARSLLVHTKRS